MVETLKTKEDIYLTFNKGLFELDGNISPDQFDVLLRHYGTIKNIVEWERIFAVEIDYNIEFQEEGVLGEEPKLIFQYDLNNSSNERYIINSSWFEVVKFIGWRELESIDTGKKVFSNPFVVEQLINKYDCKISDFVSVQTGVQDYCKAIAFLEKNNFESFSKKMALFLKKIQNIPGGNDYNCTKDILNRFLKQGLLDEPNKYFFFLVQEFYLSRLLNDIELWMLHYLRRKKYFMGFLLLNYVIHTLLLINSEENPWKKYGVSRTHFPHFFERFIYTIKKEILHEIRNEYDAFMFKICIILIAYSPRSRLDSENFGDLYMNIHMGKAYYFYSYSIMCAREEKKRIIISRLVKKRTKCIGNELSEDSVEVKMMNISIIGKMFYHRSICFFFHFLLNSRIDRNVAITILIIHTICPEDLFSSTINMPPSDEEKLLIEIFGESCISKPIFLKHNEFKKYNYILAEITILTILRRIEKLDILHITNIDENGVYFNMLSIRSIIELLANNTK